MAINWKGIAQDVRKECLSRLDQKEQIQKKQTKVSDPSSEGTQIFPNLKYAEPKYKNIQSLMKFVESKNEPGGVKLIIMNFND